MRAIEPTGMHVTRADEPGNALGRGVMASPFDGLITAFESALGILDIAKATSWMRTEDFAWSDHRVIFPRIWGKKSAPWSPLSGHPPGVNLKR